MEYHGKFSVFDPEKIITYPLRDRKNKVTIDNIILPGQTADMECRLDPRVSEMIEVIARHVLEARSENKPVILFSGGHLIKNGMGMLAADLVDRGMVTLVGGQGSTAIHDFELALIGATSEHVPKGLEHGTFGMAYEFSYFNSALLAGNRHKLGFGEALGRMICDEGFREQVLAVCAREDSPRSFRHPDVSLLCTCYERAVPFTVHAGIGTDVTDQHPSFDGEAKGGCSGRDFLIFAEHISRFRQGGVALNIGSAVTGPEVLLKAVSMAANIGEPPRGIVTADFDLRDHISGEMIDETSPFYYMRDQKSVVTRVPSAYGGEGYYVQGYQQQTFLYLYKKIVEGLDKK